jgi:arginyl-tRNA synthetase
LIRDFPLTLYLDYTAHLNAALDQLPLVEGLNRANIAVEPPRDPAHGDLATNAAMVLAKGAGVKPRDLAEALKPLLEVVPGVTAVEIAGPGFINLRLADSVWRDELTRIHAAAGDYGRSDTGANSIVNIEYVSANPTGPMHMGHCRGAVVGDALATLLQYSGHRVIKEYYVNDAGGQVDVLARSAHVRYREALGADVGDIPEGLYPGDYLIPVGQALAAEFGDKYADAPEAEWLVPFRTRAVAAMLVLIKADLALLGIHHDVFSSEAEVQAARKPEAAEARLRADGLVYDGVLEAPKGQVDEEWEPVELPLFRSTQFGDDQDRPIKKSDGSWTYFGADMAYHFQKSETADALIDIWGADHAGTVKRIRAAVAALTGGKPFDVKLIQMVRLLRDGEPVKMSKRSGNFVTLADVVNEVGKDVVRFTMLSRKADAQMDFDFAKVVEASKDNPVFYVQYAHARIKSLGRKIAEAGIERGVPDATKLDAEDLGLIRLAAQFPRIVESAAASREPHRVAFYLYDLAAAFHAFFNVGNDRPDRRVLMVNDPELTQARLFMADGIGQIIRNGLAIMGVTAAEEM